MLPYDTIVWHAGWWLIRPRAPEVKERLVVSKKWLFDPAGLKAGFTEAFVTSDRMLVRRFLDLCDRHARLKALESA